MAGPLVKIALFLYRVWFYILVAIPIIVCFPILLLLTLSESTYKQFFWLARNIWASFILYGMGCFPRIQYDQKLESRKNYMLVANHTSMLDIMLMLRVSKNPFVFVGKKELARIPLFGFFYRRVCILVDREDSQSRMRVYRRAQARLNQGLSICIFPEGGVPEENVVLDEFKEGAFRMAIARQIPLVPITFFNAKERFPFSLNHGGPGWLKVRVHPFLQTEGLNESHRMEIKQQLRAQILEDLTGGTA